MAASNSDTSIAEKPHPAFSEMAASNSDASIAEKRSGRGALAHTERDPVHLGVVDGDNERVTPGMREDQTVDRERSDDPDVGAVWQPGTLIRTPIPRLGCRAGNREANSVSQPPPSTYSLPPTACTASARMATSISGFGP